MNKTMLYEAIFHRKSVRKYDMNPVSSDVLDGLRQFTESLVPLDESIRFELTYLTTQDVKNLLPIKAPHYLCIYAEQNAHYLMNAGFLLQQVDLYLSANGLGSCWLGMAKPSKQVPASRNGLEFVIMLAFGNPSEPVHRTSPFEFNRKPLSAVCNITDGESVRLLEPVRLAPSASNTQTWFFGGESERMIVGREKLHLIKAAIYGKMNQIDIGIALCHLWLSCENQGKTMQLDFEPSKVPEGYEFMAGVKVVQRETV